MALSQQKFREMVFQLLYSDDMARPQAEAMLDLMMSELAITKRNVKQAQERVETIRNKLGEIDPLITSVSTSYEFNRIQTVTKNILRLGVFELFFDDQIPPKVAIAEAIRLSRKFGTPESAAFVNALLDHLYRLQQGETQDLSQLERQARQLAESEQQAQQAALEAKNLQEPEDEDSEESI